MLIIACAGLFITPNGYAQLTERTDATLPGGANNVTFDSLTGLEWLDVTATTGIATAGFVDPNDPRAGVPGNPQIKALLDAGFRLATAQQVATLFVNAGIPSASHNATVPNPAIESAVLSLMDFVGISCAALCSSNPPLGPYTQGGAEIFEPSLNFTAYYPLLGVDPNGNGAYAWTTLSANRGSEATNFGLGNWLVRAASGGGGGGGGGEEVFIEQQKLTASDAAAEDHFGWSTAISGDTAIVGAHLNDDAGDQSGSAYVFVRSGDIWTEQQKLMASDAATGDWFGYSVAISGNTAVVGAPYDDDKGGASGSVYVFTRTGSTWTQQQKLTASDGTLGDLFGYAVAISDDTIVIGSAVEAAYVFIRSGGTWREQQKLTASDAIFGDLFGLSVAISGNTVVVGAYGDDDTARNSGSAYVFVRNGATWTEQQKLTASDPDVDDEFAWSVAISNNTAVIGSYNNDDAGLQSGSAYVFVGNGARWTEQQKLTATDTASGDQFGWAVAVAGNTAVIAAPSDVEGLQSGSVYVFRRNGGIWQEKQKLIADDADSFDRFGHTVGIAVDGNSVIVGAYENDDEGFRSGSAYVFVKEISNIILIDGFED